MSAIRLISQEFIIHTPDVLSNKLISKQNYILPQPKGKFLLVCFYNHTSDINTIHPLIQNAIDNDIGIVYVCDKLPTNPIIHENITYIEAPDRWFTHTLFLSPLKFSGVLYGRSTQKLARAFSEFTQYKIHTVSTERNIYRLNKNYDRIKDNVLVEIIGGVGDHLLSIPSLKTLDSFGKNVYVLCDDQRKLCFNNLSYIKGFYSARNQIDVSRFPKIILLHFGQLLNDYRQDFNKQNRIYAVAEICGIRKEELVIDRPEIILTKEEKESAEKKWKPYKNKIFLGADSARVDSKLPSDITQNFINRFKQKGYTTFISSNRRNSFNNCIDLNKKLTLRELFSLIAMMDCVVTVDTAFLHIAGAFNKKIFCMFNYFKPEWRSSTYTNCVAYKPKVSCYPCVSKQFVPSCEWMCHKNSCYEYQDVDKIYEDIDFYLKKETKIIEPKLQVIEHEIIPKDIAETNLPGKLISSRKSPTKKIATFWMGGIGDAVMLSYLCRAIKRKYPDSNIDAFVRDKKQIQLFVFDYPTIKANHSKLNWKKTFDLIKGNYDLIYEFRPYPVLWDKNNPTNIDLELYNNWQKATGKILENSTVQTFKYYAQQVGLEITPQDVEIPIFYKENLFNKIKNKYNLPDNFVTFTSGCDQNVGKLKLWDKNKWEDLITKLGNQNIQLVQLGNDTDINFAGIQKIKADNLIDLMYILKRSSLHISNEGGIVHLAHALGTKSVVLFGPTNPTLYGYSDNFNIYYEKCPSCWWTVSGWSSNCKRGYPTCVNIDQIEVEEVYSTILQGIKQ